MHSRTLSAAGQVALFLVLTPLVLAVSGPLTRRIPGTMSLVVAGAFSCLATLVLTVLFVRWSSQKLRDVGAQLSVCSFPRFLLGFTIGLVLVAVQMAVVFATGRIHWTRGTADLADTGLILIIYLLFAAREELAFHGYPLRRLDRFFGPVAAQITVAIVFAIEHRIGGYTWINAILGAGIGSLMFGMASLSTRGLAVPLGLHAAWNYGQWMLGQKDNSGPLIIHVQSGFEAQVARVGLVAYVVVISLATTVFAFHYHYRKR